MRWISAIFTTVFIILGSAQAGQLFDAAKQGDTATVKALLESGTSVDERGPNKATPLIAASLAGNTETAAALIEAGADVMARNHSGFTPLHAAAKALNLGVCPLDTTSFLATLTVSNILARTHKKTSWRPSPTTKRMRSFATKWMKRSKIFCQ